MSPDPKGALAGGTMGYNFQTGTWVWGVEADLDWSGMKGDVTCPGGTCTTKNDWLGTARGAPRLRRLEQLDALHHGGRRLRRHQGGKPGRHHASKTKIGWTAGLGLEYALRSNWSVKLEYLYADLGSFDCGLTCGAATDNVSFKTNIVRAGVNYRF